MSNEKKACNLKKFCYNKYLLRASLLRMDGFPSGQRGQTVNLLHIASVVRIHLHPLNIEICLCRRGGTGRRTGLKILRDLYSRTGSIPVAGMMIYRREH